MSGEGRRPTIRPGETLPEFRGPTANGTTVSRQDLLGRPAVLFFYPKANSAGCSIEAREFARLHPRFAAAGVTVVGVSVDSAEDQARFRDSCQLPFELVADRDRTLSRAFGVLGGLGVARRTTVLVGADGKVLEVVRSWRPSLHAREALERLTRTTGAAAPAGSSEHSGEG